MRNIYYALIAGAVVVSCTCGVVARAEDAAPATPAAAAAPTAEATQPAQPAATDPVPVAPAPAPAFVAPVITADTSIFRRTPVIDGVVEDGEWDAFYSFTASGWDATTYVDWDSNGLYIGVKSSKPVDLLTVLDGNCDGWFHGDDNYEFKTSGGLDGNMALMVSKYDSHNAKSPVASPLSPEEASAIEIKSGHTDSLYMIEMKIPAGMIKGIKLAPERKIGLQINLNGGDALGGWIPSKEIGDTRECELVTKKFVALKPLDLGLVLRSERVARGDEVVGRFHLTNTGADPLDVRSYVIGGEGKAGEFLSSEKIRLEGISAKKHIAQEIKSVVPKDMRLGSWAIGAEVRSGTDRMGSALVSFEVVEPFEIELKLPTNKIKPDVKDVTFSVGIRNNTRGRIRGTAKIELPTGWELWRGVSNKELSVPQGDGMGYVSFKAKPPLGVAGDVPVKISVTVDGKTMQASGKVVFTAP